MIQFPKEVAATQSGSSLSPEHIIWRFPDVHTATGLSRTSIWRHVRDGSFPAPIQLTGNLVGWIAKEVIEWRNSRPRTGK